MPFVSPFAKWCVSDDQGRLLLFSLVKIAKTKAAHKRTVICSVFRIYISPKGGRGRGAWDDGRSSMAICALVFIANIFALKLLFKIFA